MNDPGFVWDRAQYRWVLAKDVSLRAVTANQEDHSDPWQFAGEIADPPTNPVGNESVDDSTQLFQAVQSAPVARSANPWRNCNASVKLLEEINARWPGRDKTSDGTIGDAAHAARTSDHNPWVVIVENGRQMGIVRARDIDRDGIDAAWLAEYLRQLGLKRDPRLFPNGYVIFNRRITNPDFGAWREYTGSNPHTAHVHVSFSTNREGYDSAAAWGLNAQAPSVLNPEDDDLDANQAKMLQVIYDQLTGNNFKGWDQNYVPDKRDLTMVDLIRRSIQQNNQLMSVLPNIVDPNHIAQAVMANLQPLVAQAVRDTLGEADQDKADAIVEAIGRRLIGTE